MKYRVTLEVDQNTLFDMVAQCGQEFIGATLLAACLCPTSVDVTDAIALSAYGVIVGGADVVERPDHD